METILVSGNEAVGWGALSGGCEAFFGYPITPQNEIPEWFSREFPNRDKVFLQSQSETGSINMLFGAAAAGVRVMTSTSGPGWSLMLETMSHCANAELPCVIALVSRGGPGMGTVQHSQMDYTSTTRGGGHGGYKNIVLAPASIQEIHDLVARAFHLADKYRNPVIVLMDGVLGHMWESLRVRDLEFTKLPKKEWALVGTAHHKEGKSSRIGTSQGMFGLDHPDYISFLEHLQKKYNEITASEMLYENYLTEDADIILIAYGYAARSSRRAVHIARAQGMKVGLFRPITVWPFPHQRIKDLADRGANFLVVEDSLGQMVEDVRIGATDNARIQLLGVASRHLRSGAGYILPETIFNAIKEIKV